MTTKTPDKTSNKTTAKNTRTKGLKKGSLEFLLSSAGLDEASVLSDSDGKNSTTVSTDGRIAGGSSSQQASQNTGVLSIDIEKIVRSPFQPRKTFTLESLQELSDSIKSKGLIQPIVVRKKANNYELIAGERRWRACQMAGLHKIPVVIRQVDDETALVMAIVENIQREDLNPIEEAKGLQRLIDEFAMTQQQVADVVGRSRSAVTNLLRLLGLSPKVQNLVEENKLEMGHARALLSLDNNHQVDLANRIIFKDASVRDAEQWVREIIHGKANSNQKGSEYISDPNIDSLQTQLSETLGAKVTISHSNTGKGKLVINYHSLDELEGIITKIN